ncbi:MAG: PD-(D/E)XK nuclease family protein [Clostridia bacterium]|nr:PD-(D/E)XK nuclease family protein [Clostridia bacterium]
MIEFIFGREATQKTEYIIEKMKECLKNGKKAVLLIPEHQALFWDTLTAKRFSPTDAFNIETVSFTRLADSVFRRFGGSAKRYVTDSEKLLLMWSALNGVSEGLRVFGSSKREDRYVPLMLRARSELRLYGIGDEDIARASEMLGEEKGSLSGRLHDLALISSAYDTLLHSSYDDPEEIPDALADVLSNNDYFGGSCVFLDSFYTLTPKEMKVVRLIMSQADDFYATFAMARGDRDMPHVSFIFDYVKDMARCASSLGYEIKITDRGDTRKVEFEYMSRALWDFSSEPYRKATDAVCVIKCSDRYDEASLAAAKIKDIVSAGASFSDIAVVCADFESLRGITDAELWRYGIPVYVAGKTPVTSQPAARLLLSAVRIVARGWRSEDVIAAARTGLCSLSSDETDALEMYTDKWSIRGKKKFCTPDGWEMNADGYTESESRWGRELLSLANSAREKLIPPLEAFSEAFPGSIKDICSASYKLLCDFGVYESLKSEAVALERAGRFADAQKKSQVYGVILKLLDTLALCVPDGTCDAPRFLSLLSRIGDTLTIGTIPDGIDRVALGSVGSVRLDGIKHLIVLGAKSGEFPRVPKDDGFFSDNDKKILKDMGIELSPDSSSRQNEELFRFAQTVAAPCESLTVIIPADGDACHPSLGALRLMKLFPNCRTFDFTSPEGEEAIRGWSKNGGDETLYPLSADNDRVTGAAQKKLFDCDISLTQSRIECFTSCAFSYYCRYILKLDEGERAELRPGEVGTFVHAILENLMREISETASFPVEEARLYEMCDRLISDYRAKIAPDDKNGQTDYIFNRLSKSIRLFARSLNEEFSQSSFTPYSFELPVGFTEELPAEKRPLSNGHSLTVRGIVDRVDILRRDGKVYIRVADYKTGSKSFSLKDVLRGHNIQLLLYLFSLCNMPKDCSYRKELAPGGEDILPAGAVYFSARPGDILSDSFMDDAESEDFALDAISRTGIVLGDLDVISAMDKEISGKYAPVSIGAKNNLKGSFAESVEAFREIEGAIDTFLSEVGNSLVGGKAASDPIGFKSSSPCEYCKMLPICRHNEHAPKIDEKGGEGNE